ncbi:acyltransferase (plasmid) [Rhizobium sp. WL3]|uniref:acyltransferase family protein n=1 Tax=Rhizobium sp. WL3 TaxID=2603277 RepID=UPI0011C1DAF3|nr:acyltransferase [Rhizobium sp. WL3]QEE43671.1 acyltransferase [Rhizobium sp. WL3]
MLGYFRLALSFGVVTSHTHGYLFAQYPNTGLIAVVTFFFVSGYLMPASFQANYRQKSFMSRSSAYLTNRILRIYPLYWLALLFTLAVIAVTRSWNEYDIHLRSLLQNFILLGLNQDSFWRSDTRLIGPAWTLDVEVQYYVVVPLLILSLERFPRVLAGFVVFTIVGGLWLLLHPTGRGEIDRSIVPWAPFFLFGLVVYCWREWFGALHLLWYATAAAILMVVALFLPWSPRHAEWAWSAVSIVFAARLLTDKGLGRRRGDRLAGDLAYPVFIFHQPLMILMGLSVFQFWQAVALHITAATFLAWLAHLIVVAPIEKFRDINKTAATS